METGRPRFGSANAANVVKFMVAAGVIQSMTPVLKILSISPSPALATEIRSSARLIVFRIPDNFGARS
jgi:hypothetical protein